MAKTFLAAEWRKLIMANYAVNPDILAPLVPYQTELDFWHDRCYVSLVGFQFVNTKVLGLKIPFHVHFEEVNLRFYVRHKGTDGEWKRGVVFIKEIVPKAAITFVANTLYNEHYQTLAMRHQYSLAAEQLDVRYEWKYKGKWNQLAVKTNGKTQAIEAGSESEFIAEHYWGYTRLNDHKTSEYRVDHPSWEVYPIDSYEIDCDMSALYGERFAGLEIEQPVSVFMAEGSEITVANRKIIR